MICVKLLGCLLFLMAGSRIRHRCQVTHPKSGGRLEHRSGLEYLLQEIELLTSNRLMSMIDGLLRLGPTVGLALWSLPSRKSILRQLLLVVSTPALLGCLLRNHSICIVSSTHCTSSCRITPVGQVSHRSSTRLVKCAKNDAVLP